MRHSAGVRPLHVLSGPSGRMLTAARQLPRVVAMIALMTACTPTSDTRSTTTSGLPDGRNPVSLVSALDSAALARMELRKGSWKEADATSTWRAWVSDGKVRAIEEYMSVGDYSARRLMHYFTEDGHLAAHIESRDQMVFVGDRPPARETVLITVQFVNDSAVKAVKTVDGVARVVEPFEALAARTHAAVLLAAARDAPVVTPSPPPHD